MQEKKEQKSKIDLSSFLGKKSLVQLSKKTSNSPVKLEFNKVILGLPNGEQKSLEECTNEEFMDWIKMIQPDMILRIDQSVLHDPQVRNHIFDTFVAYKNTMLLAEHPGLKVPFGSQPKRYLN